MKSKCISVGNTGELFHRPGCVENSKKCPPAGEYDFLRMIQPPWTYTDAGNAKNARMTTDQLLEYERRRYAAARNAFVQEAAAVLRRDPAVLAKHAYTLSNRTPYSCGDPPVTNWTDDKVRELVSDMDRSFRETYTDPERRAYMKAYFSYVYTLLPRWRRKLPFGPPKNEQRFRFDQRAIERRDALVKRLVKRAARRL